MPGGNWTAQNKVLPGVYTNYVGKGSNPSVTGDRGIVALPLVLPWFAEHEILKVTQTEAAAIIASLGAAALPLREAMKNASSAFLYRLNKGTEASAILANLSCTALYSGTYGNKISVSIEAAPTQAGKFYVITWLETNEIDRQLVGLISQLKANSYVIFKKAGLEDTLAATAGTSLKNGSDGTVTNADYAMALASIETQEVDAVACMSADIEVKALFTAFAKRMIQDEGKYLQAVVADCATADFEGAISVKNGVYLEDGTHITNVLATAYIAGATAGCPLTQSLSNSPYGGAVDVDERYTLTQQTEFAKAGQLVFLPPAAGSNSALIQKDINTLVTFTNERTYALSKNKIIRTLFAVCKQIDSLGRKYYIGKVGNSASGRDQFKAAILAYFRELEGSGVLRDVVPEDITIKQGGLIDAVVVDYAIRPIDVMEVFYNTIVVEG
ncbi:MAG: phage tail sheath family protein [Hydrogenoanaerobacterium sp.]